MTNTQSELIERLRLKVHKGRFELGGGTISSDGKSTSWGGEKIMEYRNPDGPAAADEITRLTDELARARERAGELDDKTLLDALQSEHWDLRCFDLPTGGGDADVGWRVIGHWMAEPRERTVAEVYHDEPRAAIRAAITKEKKHE